MVCSVEVSLLVGCLCIPWCELSLWNINEKFHHLLSAFFILVCNLYHMDDLVLSIGLLWEHLVNLLVLANLALVSSNNTLRLK